MATQKRAKVPVGKMQRVKTGEVVTGYRVNRDKTVTLQVEKKRTSANPRFVKSTKKKRYQVRSITGSSGKLGKVRFQSDDSSRVKSWAEDHAWDTQNGMAIVDTVNDTIDFGNKVAPRRKAKNPSIRKSKKTFKKVAKRLGVALSKRLPRKLTHSKANRNRNPKTEYVVGGTPYSTLAKAKAAAKRESKSEGRAYVENASTGKTLARYEYGRQVR